LNKTKQNKNSIQFLIVKGKNKTKKEKKIILINKPLISRPFHSSLNHDLDKLIKIISFYFQKIKTTLFYNFF